MDKLGKILETVLARQPRTVGFIEARLRLALAVVLGGDLAGGCGSIEVRKSTLWITTSNRDGRGPTQLYMADFTPPKDE